MDWVYLSPHLDDAALSCGGLIWEQVRSGERVQVWTICAGEPPQGEFSMFARVLHRRWGIQANQATAGRRLEDLAAMRILGADAKHFSIPDAIYRRHPKTDQVIYRSWEDIINGVDPGDAYLVERLAGEIAKLLTPEIVLVSPLSLGNHVDHLLTRAAAERLGQPIYYYLDFPYTREASTEILNLIPVGYTQHVYQISEEGLSVWQQSVGAYPSQISTFWSGEEQMRIEIADHCEEYNGVAVWQPSR